MNRTEPGDFLTLVNAKLASPVQPGGREDRIAFAGWQRGKTPAAVAKSVTAHRAKRGE